MSTATKPPKAPKPPKEPRGAKGAKGAKAPTGRRAAAAVEPAAVNLLSPWVLDGLHVSRLRRRFGLGVLTLALVLGLAWVGLSLQLNRAEEEVRGEEAVTSGLKSQMASLSTVRTYVTNVNQRGKTVAAVTAAETQFSRALAALDDALPRSAKLDSLSVTLPTRSDLADGSSAVTCPGPDPFGARKVVACMELTGTADSRADVSTFVQELASGKLFVEPFVATTTNGTERGVTFTGSVGIAYAALSDPAAAQGADADDPDAETEEGSR